MNKESKRVITQGYHLLNAFGYKATKSDLIPLESGHDEFGEYDYIMVRQRLYSNEDGTNTYRDYQFFKKTNTSWSLTSTSTVQR